MTSHANVGVGTLALTHPPPARSNAGPWPGSKPKTRPAQGTVRGVAAYGRAAPTCETAGGKAELVPEKAALDLDPDRRSAALPRQTDDLEGIALRVICTATEQSVQFHGSLKPEVTNRTVIRASPEQTRIRRRLGHLQSTVGAGEVTGRWKALGYEAQELTQVMNRWAASSAPPQRSQP
jgi:hypothetical protein